MSDPGRAVIFGRDAATYDQFRPSYPRAVVEHVLSLVDQVDAVEIGAGTGKATADFARPGLRITCLEPSPAMAEILEDRQLPGVRVEVTRFEDWDPEPESADLIYAAQAWHWVNPESGFNKARMVLRPGGVLSLFWNIPLDRYGAHEEVYRRYAPQLLAEQDQRIQRRDDHDWCADMEVAGFVATQRFTYHWSDRLHAEDYKALYSTYSDHMMLEEPARSSLLDALADDVQSGGGWAAVEYRSEVFSGRKPDTDPR